MKARRVLVVGGSGFLGRHICRMAAATGYEVTTLSLHQRSNGNSNVSHLYADIRDLNGLRQVLRGRDFEYVVNCAGYIDHRPFREGGRDLIASHFEGVQNLIEALNRTCLVRFVQIGSSDEYGPAPAPQREDMREEAISPYSLAKLSTTHLLQMLWRTEEFPATILRLYLTYGPGQDSKRLLPQVIEGCLANRSFPVSEGRQLRDFCYVEDIAKGILEALTNSMTNGEVINLASGEPTSVRAVIECIHELVGHGSPDYGKIAYRTGENMELYANISKARRVLGWSPRTSLIQGLRLTIGSYRSRKNED